MRYDFEDVLSAPPPAATRSCQPPARMHCPSLPPLVVPSAAQSPCVVSSTPLLSSCRPPPDRLAVVSPLHPCLARPPLPSHRVVHRPPTFLFDCCVLDWRRRDVVADPMSCIVRPFPLVMSPLHPCLVHPPPPLIVLSAAHPLFYLIVVCWIGRDGTWSTIRCLALSTPSLSSCYLPPACFASCSPPTPLPYLLIVMYWLMSLPSLEIDTTSDEFLSLAPVPSILCYSVTKAFLRYSLTSRHKIVPKNCNVFLCDRAGLSIDLY